MATTVLPSPARLRKLRTRIACALLRLAGKVAAVKVHAEATRQGRKVAVLAVGSQTDDIAGLLVKSTTALAQELMPDELDDDEDDYL